MEAYLDNAATTKTDDAVISLMETVMRRDYGNPSSMHKIGMIAENHIKTAKEQLCGILKCEPSEIIFTSGGTESNNLALIGAAMANKRAGNHIISTRIEHASVYQPLFYLEENGFRVTYVGVDAYGKVKKDELLDAIGEDTILVSVMYVNNEIGAVEDIAEIGAEIKHKKPSVLFHVDAIQAFGKLPVIPKKASVDLLSVSGHKIHGPKGSGFLYIRQKTKIKAMLLGGEQQKGMRSGTENVPAIAGLGLAAERMYRNFTDNTEHLYHLKQHFIEEVSKLENTVVNGIREITPEAVRETAPHIVSVSFSDIRSEVLLHALEEKGIYVSSGSACSSNHPAISGTLKAVGVKKELLDSTLRFSFSKDTTEEEIDYTIEQLKELCPKLRKYTRH